MRWKAYVYGSAVFWFILSLYASVVMEKQDSPGAYLLWKALFEFTWAVVLLIIGLGMILDHRHWLRWLGTHLNFRPPTLNFCLLGWLFFLGSLVILATSIMDLFIVLGILPNLYAPDSAVWFLRREVGPLSWTLRVRSC